MRKFRKQIVSNPGLKIIALVIACGIWLFVTNDNDPTGSMTIANVPINIVNEDSIADIGKVVEPQGSGTVTVKVTERRSVRNRLSRTGNNFYVEADLENINQLNTVPLTVTCDNPAVTWDEISISPASLKVKLEDKVEQSFQVNIVVSGESAEGTAVGKTELAQGKSILIAGPESLISIIGTVNAPVSVLGVSQDAELTSSLRIYDKNGAEFTESQLGRLELKSADGNLLPDRSVTVLVTLWELNMQLPLEVSTYGDVADGYEITGIELLPETIALAGTAETFGLIGNTLKLKDRVSVYNASDDITTELDLGDTLSDYSDIKLMGDTDTAVTVTVHISKLDLIQVEIPISDIALKGRPDNMKLIFTPADKITVGLHAEEGTEGDITASDIKASMDLSACSREGNYEIPVELVLPDGYELSEQVTMRVSSTEEDESTREAQLSATLP